MGQDVFKLKDFTAGLSIAGDDLLERIQAGHALDLGLGGGLEQGAEPGAGRVGLEKQKPRREDAGALAWVRIGLDKGFAVQRTLMIKFG